MTALTLTAPSAIFSAPVDATAKLVFLALHHFRDWHEGTCFPSQKRLAAMVSKSRSSVCRAIKTLQQHGLIVAQRRKRAAGGETSCHYDLKPSWPDAVQPRAPAHTPCAPMHTPCAPVHTSNSSHRLPSHLRSTEDERAAAPAKSPSAIPLSAFSAQKLKGEINARRFKLGIPPLDDADIDRMVIVLGATCGERERTEEAWRRLTLAWGIRERISSRKIVTPERGKDELPTAGRPWHLIMKQWQRTKRWMRDQYGPAPGEPGCQVPRTFLEAFA